LVINFVFPLSILLLLTLLRYKLLPSYLYPEATAFNKKGFVWLRPEFRSGNLPLGGGAQRGSRLGVQQKNETQHNCIIWSPFFKWP